MGEAPPHNLGIIYERAVLPILQYGIQMWGHRLSTSRNRRTLRTVHGMAMRNIIGAHSTVSEEAAQTIAGYPALHHLLQIEYSLSSLKSNGTTVYMGIELTADELPRRRLQRQRLIELAKPSAESEWCSSAKGSVIH